MRQNALVLQRRGAYVRLCITLILMQRYTRPHLAVYGLVADLTKGKVSTGTDSFDGGQPQPGACLGTPIGDFCPSSQDNIVFPTLP